MQALITIAIIIACVITILTTGVVLTGLWGFSRLAERIRP